MYMFSFKYAGKIYKMESQSNDCDFKVETQKNGDEITTTYTFKDGLKITNILKNIDKFGACEWVNWFENTGDKLTGIISDVWDSHFSVPMEYEEPYKLYAYMRDFDEVTQIYNPSGSSCSEYEFRSVKDENFSLWSNNYLKIGEVKKYGSSWGRSSDNESAPFFNIHKKGKGFIAAVGWSGQWHAEVERLENEVVFKSGISGLNFSLLPGEKIRTSSIVVMPYESSVIDSQNKWRRLVKEEYSLIGREGRDKYGPLCTAVWGGMRTSAVLKRIETIKENNIPYDYIWMDAGWYGKQTPPTPDEWEGAIWSELTGDWRVSEVSHPDGLKDVSKAIHDAGMKFLLWLEPERSKKGSPAAMEHPEYFLGLSDDVSDNPLTNADSLILNLGNEDAWNYIYNTIADMIEELNIDFYRQDANFGPVYFWDAADSRSDRNGITQIKHIMGLYRLWDTLLERFPHLCIDNCASGGRRIDIETLRRSIPLWRSDYHCIANSSENVLISHHMAYNSWLPYSGTTVGRKYDLYRARCAYDSSFTSNYTYCENENYCDTTEKLEFVKKMFNEYLMLRPYFSEDYYPLTEVSASADAISAVQFDRPSENDGILQIFRREKSPCISAVFELYAIDENAEYTFTDIDDNSQFTISGKELKENGFGIEIKKKRTAKIFIYKKH